MPSSKHEPSAYSLTHLGGICREGRTVRPLAQIDQVEGRRGDDSGESVTPVVQTGCSWHQVCRATKGATND